MKANLALVVSLVVALSLMTFGAEAANETLSVPSDISVTAGTPKVIPVNIDDASAMTSYRVTMAYDSAQLQYNSVALGDVTPGWAAPTVNSGTPGLLIIVGFNAASGVGSGCLLRITFTPLPGVTGGDFDLYEVTEPGPIPPNGPYCHVNGYAPPDITVTDGSFVAAGAPTVTIDSVLAPGPTNAMSIPITVEFSEAVTGFDDTDVIPLLVNCTLNTLYKRSEALFYPLSGDVDGINGLNAQDVSLIAQYDA